MAKMTRIQMWIENTTTGRTVATLDEAKVAANAAGFGRVWPIDAKNGVFDVEVTAYVAGLLKRNGSLFIRRGSYSFNSETY